jgi:hypothetical protein
MSPTRVPMALIDRTQIRPSPLVLQPDLLNPFSLGYILDGAIRDIWRKKNRSMIVPLGERRNPVDIIQATEIALARDPPRRLAVALHEAGHVLYARRAGAIEIVYHGPLEYPGRPDDLGEAGVQPVFPYTGAHIPLLAMARWFSAGSVVKRVLAPSFWEDGEDGTDWDVFVEYANKLLAASCPANEQLRQYWVQAQQDVERDLRSPAFRREMWALAREVEKKIPWSSTTPTA